MYKEIYLKKTSKEIVEKSHEFYKEIKNSNKFQIKEDSENIKSFISNKKINGFYYEVKFKLANSGLKHFIASVKKEKNIENFKDYFSNAVIVFPLINVQEMKEKVQNDPLKKYEELNDGTDMISSLIEVLSERSFSINDIKSFREFINLFEIKSISSEMLDHCLEDINIYELESNIYLKTIFNAYDLMPKSKSFNDNDYHYNKYEFNNKDILVFSNSASCVSYFIIFEKDKNNEDYKVYLDVIDNIDNNFKFKSIIIGKYPEIIKHYVENKDPDLEFKNGRFTSINNPNIIKHLDDHYDMLFKMYQKKIKKEYNEEDLEEVLKYMKLSNLNELYTYGLWSKESKWIKNEKGEFYIDFEDLVGLIKYNENGLSLIEDQTSYVSVVVDNSPMLKIPKGKIKKDYLNLINESYKFIKNNKEKMKVCDVTDKQIEKVGKILNDI